MTAKKDKGTPKQQAERLLRLIRGRCEEEGECWLWTGATGGHSNLPCIHVDGKTQYVRRVVYDLANRVPAGARVVTPKCTNPMCVSPKCQEAMTRKEALQRAGQRGSYSKPTRLIMSALTQRAKSRYSDELVAQIRLAEAGPTELARETGMSLSHVKAIRSATARRDLTGPFASLLAANDSSRRAA